MNSFLGTKFYPPSVNKDFIENMPLIEEFLSHLDKRLTCVIAPAGYGKTSFVGSCLRHQQKPYSWISLDEQDQDPAHFLNLLLHSLQGITEENHFSSTENLLENPNTDTGQILIALINDFLDIRHDVILVLDDLHLIDSKDVEMCISFIIEHKPMHIKLVLISREDPNLQLARIRGQNELSEFRLDQLKFTKKEASLLFCNKFQLELTDAQITQLVQQCEGWITGLQLAAISIKNADNIDRFIKNFSQNHHYILDYLIEEVMQNLTSSLKNFLVKAAYLKKFNSVLCNFIFEQSNSQKFISEIEQQNLFLIPLDNENNWYRFHHLFSQITRVHSRVEPQEVSSFLRNAAKWFYDQGLIEDAIEHAIYCQDADLTASMLEQEWPNLRATISEKQFLNWLESIPEPTILKYPTLMTYYSVALLAKDFVKAQQLLESVEKSLSEPSNFPNFPSSNNLLGIINIGKAYAASATQQTSLSNEKADFALKHLSPHEFTWIGAAYSLKGMNYWKSGDLNSAVSEIQQGHLQMKHAKTLTDIVSTGYLLARLHMDIGNWRKGQQICHELRHLSDNAHTPPQGIADIYLLLAEIAFNKADIKECLSHLDKYNHYPDSAKLNETRHRYYAIQANLAIIEERYTDALDLIQESKYVFIPSPYPDYFPIQGLELLHNSKSKMVQISLKEENEYVFDGQLQHEYTAVNAIRCQLNIFSKQHSSIDPAKIIEQLNMMKTHAINNDRPSIIFEVSLLSSLFYLIQNNKIKAKEHFLLALDNPLSESKCILFLLDLKPHLKTVQPWLSEIRGYDWLKQTFQSAHPKKTDSTINQSSNRLTLIEPLSARELEVLKYLETDLSGPQIAEALFVSMNTIRTHTKNIYSKLGVNNRRAAIRVAKEL